MNYISLKKVYYSNNSTYETEYERRFNSEYAHHIDFQIRDSQAFFVVTPEIQQMMITIQKTDKAVFSICKELPPIAINQFSNRCLVDEIMLTNRIENVHSTRREIRNILIDLEKNDKKVRFNGLVRSYKMLRAGEKLVLKSCQDIRTLYDNLVLTDVVFSDPDNRPDGEVFRKGPVNVLSSTQKVIHTGLYPETKIINAMEKALNYLNDDSEELLYRTAAFHYFLGYIHPFYDGNGRLNRFISSYMLSKELEPVIGFRLSYTIQENLKKYYDIFKICNDPLSKGDITPFISAFLEIIEQSIVALDQALRKRKAQWTLYERQIPELPEAQDEKVSQLYSLLIQAALFSEHGISTKELLQCTQLSRSTLRKKMEIVGNARLLKKDQLGRENYFEINLKQLDGYMEWKKNRQEADE